MSTTNGGPAPQPGAPQMPGPQIGVLMQYVKDFSFENPNAPRSLTPGPQQPSIKINIGVEAAPLAENDVEVVLRLDGKAEVQGSVLFGFELLYAGVFRVLNRTGSGAGRSRTTIISPAAWMRGACERMSCAWRASISST